MATVSQASGLHTCQFGFLYVIELTKANVFPYLISESVKRDRLQATCLMNC